MPRKTQSFIKTSTLYLFFWSTSDQSLLEADGTMLSRLLLLLMLYMLQGVPFAMLQQSLPALLARSLSFGDLGILSFAMLPFALKVMLAPAVDILWWKRFGRRRSWVVPCTAATAVLWLVLSLTIEECMAAHATGQLSTALFAIILLLSAQDAAVDAWALELIEPLVRAP